MVRIMKFAGKIGEDDEEDGRIFSFFFLLFLRFQTWERSLRTLVIPLLSFPGINRAFQKEPRSHCNRFFIILFVWLLATK